MTSPADQNQIPVPVQSALAKAGVSYANVLQTQTPFPKGMLLFPTKNAEKDWLSLAASLEGSGFWPIIVGDRNDLRVRSEMLEGRSPQGTQKEIDKASQFNYAQWEKKAKSEVAPMDYNEEIQEDEYLQFNINEIVLTSTPGTLKSAVSSNQNEPLYIAIIECKSPTHIPAILSLGEFNSCPSNDIHIGLIQKLQKDAGAQLMSLTSDTVELHLTQLPKSQKALAELSTINYLWASDVVGQGTESVPALAEMMQQSNTMFLWWD